MNRTSFLIAVVCVLLLHSVALAQSQELPKFEVAAEFTSFERGDFTDRTEPGFGGRFTYNLNRVFSLEAAGYFLPKECFGCANNGRVTQAFGGVKIGKRFENWGIFAKARPGVVRFSQGEFDVAPTGPVTPTSFFEIIRNPVTSFATDIGGVLEFYPSKRIVTRFDAGDTIIYFTRRPIISLRSTLRPTWWSLGQSLDQRGPLTVSSSWRVWVFVSDPSKCDRGILGLSSLPALTGAVVLSKCVCLQLKEIT